MAYKSSSESIEALAAAIGDNVYIDVAKWHLYLRDAHLHTTLAERFYPMLSQGKVEESQVVDVLKKIPVKLGGGKLELPLSDLLPMQSQVHLIDALEDFQREM